MRIKLPNERAISIILGAIIVIVVGFLVFNYFNTINREGVKEYGRECICR